MSVTEDTMKRFLLLISLLVGCGAEQACQSSGGIIRQAPPQFGDCLPEHISPRVHDRVKYAIELFSQDATRHEAPCYKTPIIGFLPEMPPDLDSRVIGYCSPGSEVRFLTPFWEDSSATTRLTLVYHELGHCALGLDHTDGEADIMNTYLLDERTADSQWDELVTKMFERSKQ
jgi:hypothetical protein